MSPKALSQVEAFFRFLELERQVSPHTVAAYRLELAALVSFCDAREPPLARDTAQPLASTVPVRRWRDLQPRDVRDFAARSYKAGLCARSVQRRLSAVRSFMTYLGGEGAIRSNPAEGIQGPKVNKHLPGVLTVDQMQKLLEIQASDELAVRDKAFMELLYSSALRLIELIRLDISDIDMRDRTARIWGKGSKERIVPVGSKALAAVQRWLTLRRKLVASGEAALFIGRNGRRLTPRAVQIRIAEWAQKQGLSVHVHPHLFRHTCATHLHEASVDLRVVQELLGHANLSTTAIYTQLDFAHLAQVYNKAHPRASRLKPAE